MTILAYDIGDLVRCATIFMDAAQVVADPTAVSFKFTTPSGAVTTYTYPASAQLVKDSTGHYHVDINATEHGDWHYLWISTGTGQAAEPGQFVVRPRMVQ